jgi:hypothetical protein
MKNIYTLTEDIHKLLKQREIIIGNKHHYTCVGHVLYPSIQQPQIRQILISLKDKYTSESKAEALCARWLDGLEPMFERVPVKVLDELKEALSNDSIFLQT